MNDKEQKYIFSVNLKKLVASVNLPQKDIAKSIGVSPQTFNTWIKGIAIPRMGKIQKLADYFQIEKSNLLELKTLHKNEIEQKINETVGKLVEKRQTKVLKYAKKELAEQNQIKEEQRLYSVQAVSGAAAGIGYSYDNDEIDTYYTDEEPPRHDYATVVCGDSMEPNLSNGDVVLIRAGYDNINGDIYVIDYNDKSYIKKLYHDGDRLRLVSINDKYEPIYIELPADSYLNIVGRVVGKFKPKKLNN